MIRVSVFKKMIAPRLLRAAWMLAGSMILVACGTAPVKTDKSANTGKRSDSYTLQVPNANRPDFPPPAEVIGQASQDYPDLWARMRQGFSMPMLNTDLTANRTQWYAKQTAYFERMSARSSQYLYHIVQALEERQMPRELALLPFVESAFNPQAVSSAKAAGLWQFMPKTGQHFNLQQTLFKDERRSVIASTDAALDYLQKLHSMFGDWHLALAAYNWGEGNVMRALKRAGVSGPGAYLQIKMPRETQEYVPKLMAIRNIVLNPNQYGVSLPPIANHPYFREVALNQDIDVEKAAELAGITVQEFRQLNPSSNKPVILAAITPRILLPWERAEQFAVAVNQHRGPLSSWTAWQVPSTMTVTQAAAHVGMSPEHLRNLNKIPARMKIRAGSTLLVERNDQVDRDAPRHIVQNATLNLSPNVVTSVMHLRAQRNKETVAQVARRYGQNPSAVARANGLKLSSRLQAGQVLRVTVTRAVGDEERQTARVESAETSLPSLSRSLAKAQPKAKLPAPQDADVKRVVIRGKNGKNRVITLVERQPKQQAAAATKTARAKGKTKAEAKASAKEPRAVAKTTAKTTTKAAKKSTKSERLAQSK